MSFFLEIKRKYTSKRIKALQNVSKGVFNGFQMLRGLQGSFTEVSVGFQGGLRTFRAFQGREIEVISGNLGNFQVSFRGINFRRASRRFMTFHFSGF